TFARPLDGETTLVKQMSNLGQQLDIRPTVDALAGAVFVGPQPLELGFPVAQHVGLEAEQTRDLANLEVRLVRKVDALWHQKKAHPFRTFLSTWLGLNVSTRRALIVIS